MRPRHVTALMTLYETATRTHARTVAFLTVLSLACFLSGFFNLPPVDRDEARFAQATKQMVETGDYIDIRIQDEVRYKKPAGIYWLQAAAVAASGQGADAPIWVYRIPSLLGALAIVLLTYWAGIPLVGRQAAVLAGVMMAAMLLLGVEARLAKTDAVLGAAIVAAMGVLARLHMQPGTRHPAWLAAVFWVSGGLGILVKGPIWAMVVGLAAVAQSLLGRSPKWLSPLRAHWGVPLLLAFVLPWFVAIMVLSDGAFLKLSLGEDALGKVASGQESHGAPPGTYLGAFMVTAWPMVVPLLLALGWIWRERRRREIVFLLAWIVPSWIVFELVATKLPHYVLPLYPAIALLAAQAMCEDALAKGRWWTKLLGALGVAAIVYGPPIALALLFAMEGTVSVPGIAAWLLALPLGLLAIRAGWRDRLKDAMVLAAFAAPLFYFAIYEASLARISAAQVSPRIAHAISTGAGCSPVSVMGTNAYREASLVFLVGTDLAWGDAGAAASFLAEPGCRAVVIASDDVQAFTQAAEVAGVTVRELDHIDGFNVGNGRFASVTLFSRVKP